MTHGNRSIDTQGRASAGMPAAQSTVRNQRAADDLRKSIAQAAARLIAEGLNDYQAAKRKAAKLHGEINCRVLPDDHEIESALRAHLELFEPNSQPRVLSTLRSTAIRAMSRLARFSPWLVGSVLNGSATRFSEIELELVAVEPKEFEHYLLNAGTRFEQCETHCRKGGSSGRKLPAAKYRLDFDGTTVTIALYEHHGARQRAHPANSIRHDRAQRADAERRFEVVNTKS